MIKKETPWEKRNLGVSSSIEYYFDVFDCIEEMGDEILNNGMYEYQVAHIPVGKIDILNTLLAHGFAFAETKIEIMADLKELSLPERFGRFSESLGYHKADEDELEEMLYNIRCGMFDTDKVALDPCFNAKIAGSRYALWTMDEINSGRGSAYVVTQSDKPIGFFVLKKNNEKIVESFLAGLYNKEDSAGFGFSVLYYPMAEAKKLGIKKIIAGVSSNNPDSVKMHLALGYQVKNMNYSVIKHVRLDKMSETKGE